MSRTETLRWKRKVVVVAAVAASFAGYAAIGSSTVSAGNYPEWDCSEMSASAVVTDECVIPTDDTQYTDDTVPNETYPDETIPDTVPEDTTPVETDPPTSYPEPTPRNFPPAPTTAAPAVTPAAVTPAAVTPAAVVPKVASEVIEAPAVLPVTGRGSALPTAFIAVGLLGAGSVALAFARRNSAARSSQS